MKMSMKPSFLRRNLVLLLAATAASANALAQAPSTGAVTIADLTYSGTACPEGSTSANISPDNTALTLFFSEYNITAESSSTPRASKTCLLNFKLDVPAGWRYSIFAIDYRGYANLDAGVTSEQKTSYTFGPTPMKELGTLSLSGPFTNEYLHTTAIPLSGVSWSQCSTGGIQPMTIASSATITAVHAPAEKSFNLGSSRGRPAELDLGQQILALDLVRKDSAAPCRANFSFGFSGTKAWVKFGCRAEFKAKFPAKPAVGTLTGLMTVDSMDAEIKNNYGIIWQRCDQGMWVQSDGNKPCQQVCSAIGKSLGADYYGAQCVSGEARPDSAAGLIDFKNGCWGGCNSQGNIDTQVLGPFCYRPGQTKAADRTDRAVGCFCK